MILLLPGNPRAHWGRTLSPFLPEGLCGFLITPRRTMRRQRDLLARYPWAIDNDCYNQQFDEGKFQRFLEGLDDYPRATLKFVAVPDVVGDAAATAARWQEHAPRLRPLGLPLGYVAQDGLEELPEEDFQCLFLGGTTGYKLSGAAYRLCQQARHAGKWVHVGRVNSRKRMRHFREVADSIDGTGWTIAPARELRWALRELRGQRDQLLLREVLSELREIHGLLAGTETCPVCGRDHPCPIHKPGGGNHGNP